MNKKLLLKTTLVLIALGILTGNVFVYFVTRGATNTINIGSSIIFNFVPFPAEPDSFLLSDHTVLKWRPADGSQEVLSLPPHDTAMDIIKAVSDGQNTFMYVSGEKLHKLYRQDADNSYSLVTTLQEGEWLLSVYDKVAYVSQSDEDNNRLSLQAIDTVTGKRNNLYTKEKLDQDEVFLDFRVYEQQSKQLAFLRTNRELMRAEFPFTNYEIVQSFDRGEEDELLFTDFNIIGGLNLTLIFLGRSDNGLQVSTDLGESWHDAQSGLEEWYIPFIFKSSGNNTIYGITRSGKHVFRYNAESMSWTPATIDKAWGKISGF